MLDSWKQHVFETMYLNSSCYWYMKVLGCNVVKYVLNLEEEQTSSLGLSFLCAKAFLHSSLSKVK